MVIIAAAALVICVTVVCIGCLCLRKYKVSYTSDNILLDSIVLNYVQFVLIIFRCCKCTVHVHTFNCLQLQARCDEEDDDVKRRSYRRVPV